MNVLSRSGPEIPATLRASVDRGLLAWGMAWSAAALVAFGVVSAIIPNPVFGRQIPPEPFALAVWLASAPLMGLVAATYTAGPPAASTIPGPLATSALPDVGQRGTSQGTTLGMIGSVGAFLAIGCPVCNKIALVLLGASGALTVFAPLQPFLGAASLVLLAATLAWRLRLRARGGGCAVRA